MLSFITDRMVKRSERNRVIANLVKATQEGQLKWRPAIFAHTYATQFQGVTVRIHTELLMNYIDLTDGYGRNNKRYRLSFFGSSHKLRKLATESATVHYQQALINNILSYAGE